jgi:hypothetical protein
MKKYKRNRLLEMAGLVHRSDLLLEEEDEGGGIEDLFGGGDDDDAGDDKEEGGDEEKEGEGDEKEDDEKEEEEPEEAPPAVSKADVAEFGPGQLDQAVDSTISDIFTGAMKTAQVASQKAMGYPGASAEEVYQESLKKYNLKYLMEDGPGGESETAEFANEFDLGYFTSEIARYIKNYDVLLDMEGMIFNKARQFLINKFGPELEAEFVELLATAHDVDLKGDYGENQEAPTAVGASAEAAGA